jgi:hydrogenase maturation protein HypF
MRVRRRLRVEGVVQGVGFRPHVHRVALALGLGGCVLNDSAGVLIEVEGEPEALERFRERLLSEAPPLAAVERISEEALSPVGDTEFTIAESERALGSASALVPPDVASCEACLAELFDPADRRYRYPFINCTHCGPRFTLIRALPYDRPLTSMAGFPMCALCQAEYDDPGDRRFHAQPNACPACGPRARLVDASGCEIGGEGGDAVAQAAAALLGGAVVAVKGVGGFHLACRADDARVVETLRSRKRRPHKPFAVMVADLYAARRLVELDEVEAALLCGRERPIVLACRRPEAPVADAVAPGHRELGVLLAYTPLHHLLLADVGLPLVMTSGNLSDEPIAHSDEEALTSLSGIADLFLLHDRPIEIRADDSVLRVITLAGHRRRLFVRRSRGYAPLPLSLPIPTPRPLVAVGAEQKNTVCVARGERAWLGAHVGELGSYEALCSFEDGIAHLERLFSVRPATIAHDLHPDYAATRYATRRAELEPIAVQHHHAHLAACLAEHGETGLVVGAIFDGTGFGTDGAIWGGEILVGDLLGFERVAHLWPVRLPGGERAVREPWRMACTWLAESFDGEPLLPLALRGRVEPTRWRAVAQLACGALDAPWTTSMGRLFDAVAALAGLSPDTSYEGQLAMELERLVDPHEEASYPLPLVEADGVLRLDARPLVRAVVRDIATGVAPARVAARFHNGVAGGTVRVCRAAAKRYALGTVVLAGGVFQNAPLLERTAEGLGRAGLRVLIPERLPPNDGALCYGQAAVAAARLAERELQPAETPAQARV